MFYPENLKISFETIRNSEEFSDKHEYDVVEYLYALYISNDSDILDSVIHCNAPLNSKTNSSHPYISINYASLYYNASTHPSQASFNLNVSNLMKKFFDSEEFHYKSLFFGIQAKVLVNGHNTFLTLTFIYEANQIYLSKTLALAPEKQNDAQNHFLIICLIVAFVIVVLIGVYFWRRYLMIKKRLQFEIYASKNEEEVIDHDQTQETSNEGRKDYHGFSDEKHQTEA